MIHDFLTLTGAFLSSCLYAYLLHRIQPLYTPRWVWVTVVGGVALVQAWVAIRITLGLPVDTAGHGWWLSFWHFVAAGIPIIFWQLWEDRRMLADALGWTLKERDSERNTAQGAAPMDAAARRNTERDRGTRSGNSADVG